METTVRSNLAFETRQNKKTTSSVLKSIVTPRTHLRNQSRDHQYLDAKGENVSPTRQVIPAGHSIPLASGQLHLRLHTNDEFRNRDIPRSAPTKPIEVYEDITKPLGTHKKAKSSISIKNLVGGDKRSAAEESATRKFDTIKPKKSKSSTSLSALLSKAKPSKDPASEYEIRPKDKENCTPPRHDEITSAPPIWAQFTAQPTRESTMTKKIPLNDARSIDDKIALYTPGDYSPSKQRNFYDHQQPNLYRKPEPKPRPRSAVLHTDNSTASFAETISKLRNINRSPPALDENNQTLQPWESMEKGGGHSVHDKSVGRFIKPENRKVSNDSSKSAVANGKRVSRVMAVVAAFNGKAKESAKDQARDVLNAPVDVKAIENAFESLLDARNVPQQTRDKMRALDTNIKADFLKQDKSGSGSARKWDEMIPANLSERSVRPSAWRRSKTEDGLVGSNQGESDSSAMNESPRKSRPRSRTFTLTKGRSSSKKHKSERSASRGRPKSTDLTPSASSNSITSSATAQALSLMTKSVQPVGPEEYISYLREVQMPVSVEVGKLQKLRQLLRNETVAWVDVFITRGGMTEIVGLLYRIIQVEWREEHEDMLMHETLLCLKALCTTSLALDQLSVIQPTLFPVLLAMLFDGEKKGPSEFTTRNIITSLLFTYLSTAPPSDLPTRARILLSYLRDPSPPEASQPPGFIASMHRPRPYRLWTKEMVNVTKEVFWIFIHHSNIIPYTLDCNAAEKSYVNNHFPRDRPPVAAAPHVGGVEWDATNYLASHLDLINGIIASLPSREERNNLRAKLNDCGVEKCLGVSWRTCKEKFYGAIHIGLATWIGAAAEDGWNIELVKQGPQTNELASVSPRKKRGREIDEGPPKLEMLDLEIRGREGKDLGSDDGGWL